MKTLKYPMFDGKKIWEGAKVTIDGGKIVSVDRISTGRWNFLPEQDLIMLMY